MDGVSMATRATRYRETCGAALWVWQHQMQNHSISEKISLCNWGCKEGYIVFVNRLDRMVP